MWLIGKLRRCTPKWVWFKRKYPSGRTGSHRNDVYLCYLEAFVHIHLPWEEVNIECCSSPALSRLQKHPKPVLQGLAASPLACQCVACCSLFWGYSVEAYVHIEVINTAAAVA